MKRSFSLALILVATLALLGCQATATRGGPGTANPELDRPALSVQLDREDITYLVADYLDRLEKSRFWTEEVMTASKRPLIAIWPITNNTSQHIDDQMSTLLSSIETALVNTGDVRVVDRSSQASLIRAIGMTQGAAYDQSSAQKLGRQLGVQYFFTGKVGAVDEKLNNVRRVQYSLFLQVLDVETALIEFQNEVTRSKQIKK